MKWVGMAMAGLGFLLLLGGGIFHMVARPEWTQAQALREMVLMWLAGYVFVVVGFLLHAKSE